MKWRLNIKSKKEYDEKMKKERTERISKEIDEKYEEYLQLYSSGFSINELEEELFLTQEEIMVIGCEIDILEEEIKIPKKSNELLIWSIIIFSFISGLIFKNRLIILVFMILNLIIINSTLKRIKAMNLMRVKRIEIFNLTKKSLYLELKAKVLEHIINNTI